MRTHFNNELEQLERAVIRLGHDVHQSVVAAAAVLVSGEKNQVDKVSSADRGIDLQDVANEEACLKIIALHQPVADDLRYLVTVLKVNHELERVGDLAVEIACAADSLEVDTAAAWGNRCAEIVEIAAQSLRKALAALVARDAQDAREVWLADRGINRRCRQLATELETAITDSAPAKHRSLFALFTAVGRAERLGDHVKNIAKDVIYLATGEIVRHRSKDFLPVPGAKTRVLFVCVHNSARSQMAEAWLNHRHGDQFEGRSAGLEPGKLHPLAVAAMRELGVDIAAKNTRDVFDVLAANERFDYLVTVCDEATAERCPPIVGAKEEFHWSFSDPAATEGDEAAKLAVFRNIRDDIARRIDEWVSMAMAVARQDDQPPKTQ